MKEILPILSDLPSTAGFKVYISVCVCVCFKYIHYILQLSNSRIFPYPTEETTHPLAASLNSSLPHSVSESGSVLSNSSGPHGVQPARLLCPWDFPCKNTGMGCHVLLQGIFLTQGSNPGLSNCRQILYHLSHQGNSPLHGTC